MGTKGFYVDYCLAYEPIVLPQHYEVFLIIPLVPVTLSPRKEFKEDSEWPLSS